MQLLLSLRLAAFCEVCCTSGLCMSPRRERGRGRGSTRDFRLLFFGWSVSPATLLVAGKQRKGVITFFRLCGRGRPREKGWEKEVGEPPSLFPTPVGQKKLSCPVIPRASECCFYRKENIDCRGSGCKWAFILIPISHPLDICFSKLENIGVFPQFSSIFFHSTAQFFQQ